LIEAIGLKGGVHTFHRHIAAGLLVGRKCARAIGQQLGGLQVPVAFVRIVTGSTQLQAWVAVVDGRVITYVGPLTAISTAC